MFNDGWQIAGRDINNLDSPAFNPPVPAGCTTNGHSFNRNALLGHIVAGGTGWTRNYHFKVVVSVDSRGAPGLTPRRLKVNSHYG
jgi:hypothetical protein